MKHVLVLVVALACALAAGCHPDPPPEGPIAANRVRGQAAAMDTVVMLSPTLARAIGVTATSGRRGAVGTLECRARLVNRTPQPLIVSASAVYYDGTAMPIDDETVPQNVQLPPRGEAEVHFESTSTAAAHYVIQIGELR